MTCMIYIQHQQILCADSIYMSCVMIHFILREGRVSKIKSSIILGYVYRITFSLCSDEP